MNINSYVKTFFTSKDNRWSIIQKIKEKFLSLPIVIDIQTWIMMFRFQKKCKNLSKWERYIKEQEYRYNILEYVFMCKLFILKSYIETPESCSDEEFNQAKQDILSDKIIEEDRFKDVKYWVEHIDNSEKNSSILELILDNYIKNVKRL